MSFNYLSCFGSILPGRMVDAMVLSLKLLGQFEIRDSSDQPLTLPTRKTRALLSYLAIHANRPQPRERLMALLWGDRDDKQARQSLNHALRAIRKLAEPDGNSLIESDGEIVMLRGEALVSDAARLRELVDSRPSEAAALYAGPFLDGLSVPDPAFEDWLQTTRSEFHALACKALEAAANTNDKTTAVDALRRLLTLDPLREDAHRHLMNLLYYSGDRTAALRQYQDCADILERELQVEPDATTRALYDKIKCDSGVALHVDAETPINKPQATPPPLPLTVQQEKSRTIRWHALIAAIVVAAIAGGMIVWLTTRTGPGAAATGAGLLPSLPNMPSVAVLPFINLSGDKEQEYFSDGMTEDLLTDLSKISALRVISRTSTFAYKGNLPDPRVVAREFGVSHIVEGSVRKIGQRVRITAQLIDATTGAHVWAERYDRELRDIFALQDEVRGKIVAALAVKLAETEKARVIRKGTKSIEAYDLFLKGRHQESAFTRERNAAAIRFYREAVNLDPTYADAYARLANMYDFRVRFGWSNSIASDRNKAIEYAQKALKLDDTLPFAHWTMARILSRHGTEGVKSQLDAISSLKRAIELDPNYADAYAFISSLYVGVGKPKEAEVAIERAMRLNPKYPFWYLMNRAIVRYMQADYTAAVADLEKAVERNPTAIFLHWWLAAAYAQAGLEAEAAWQVEELKALGFSSKAKDIVATTSIIRHPPYVESYITGLRKAGIPE